MGIARIWTTQRYTRNTTTLLKNTKIQSEDRNPELCQRIIIIPMAIIGLNKKIRQLQQMCEDRKEWSKLFKKQTF